MYVAQGLALLGVWYSWRRPVSWLLLSSAAIGMTAPGPLVINVGALYQMRHPFLMLVAMLAAQGRRTHVAPGPLRPRAPSAPRLFVTDAD